MPLLLQREKIYTRGEGDRERERERIIYVIIDVYYVSVQFCMYQTTILQAAGGVRQVPKLLGGLVPHVSCALDAGIAHT